jgi:aconitate hydratase
LILNQILDKLVRAGGRIHQAGCNGCIGMGQAPATHRASLRTVPRNFPGRSGTKEDAVYLCSPETAAASALFGKITDPRHAGVPYTPVQEPEKATVIPGMVLEPLKDNAGVELVKGPNIKPLPPFKQLPERIKGPVTIKVGNDISTDEILPAGTSVLPFRSNIPEISKFTFKQVDEGFYQRALEHPAGQFIIGGLNYGQGSSREHAAMSPRYLGVVGVIVKSFARIHWQNLINFGIVPLTFVDMNDYNRIDQGDILSIDHIREAVQKGNVIKVQNETKGFEFSVQHTMSARQIEILLVGGIINHYRREHKHKH